LKLILPYELQRWHIYTQEGGHELRCILEVDLKGYPNVPPEDLVSQVPVKSVVRAGYRIEGSKLITFIEREPDRSGVIGRIIYAKEDFEY
jgi:hypothetical protein